MTVEAFYLHWILWMPFRSVTMEQNLATLFAVGWLSPIPPVAIYTTLRYLLAEESFQETCWNLPWMPYEWIIYGPNFLCLALNIVFLFNLFRITCGLQKVPSTTRRRQNRICEIFRKREFRAMITFTLIFGAPQALVLFQPNLHGKAMKAYQLISIAIQMLQGMFASILLCFLNHEVRTAFLRTTFGVCIQRHRDRYGSIISTVSERVRNSLADTSRKRNAGGRTSGDSAFSVEMNSTLMLKKEALYMINNNNNRNNVTISETTPLTNQTAAVVETDENVENKNDDQETTTDVELNAKPGDVAYR